MSSLHITLSTYSRCVIHEDSHGYDRKQENTQTPHIQPCPNFARQHFRVNLEKKGGTGGEAGIGFPDQSTLLSSLFDSLTFYHTMMEMMRAITQPPLLLS